MSFPQNLLSAEAVFAEYLSPDTLDFVPLQSYERGGVAVGDGSQGRQVADWLFSVSGDQTGITLQRLDGGTITTLVSGAVGITEVSGSFDSNMQPSVAYFESGVCKFRWYDSSVSGFVTTTYSGVTSFKVSADDKRVLQSARSDVMLGYTRADVLYWRQQRDRYLIEYTGGPAVRFKIRRFGMNEINRMQFEMQRTS